MFDLRYCFFVVMGGIRVDIHDINPLGPSYFPDMIPLSPSGVEGFARLGNFFPMSSADIEDRSKANIFQKALVLVQISWMAIQCVARTIAGAPISLLEIHTMVHVLCATMLYCFWLKVSIHLMEFAQI
jgi:hypothetical protein